MTLRLYCLPHAGGNSLVYRNWGSALAPAEIEVRALDLPGHGTRRADPLATDINTLVDNLADSIRPELGRPYALFGHSLGALLAFELARCMRRMRTPLPTYVFVAGRRAPTMPDREQPVSQLDDAGLLNWLQLTGGTPRAILDEPEVMQVMLPLLRADLLLGESYVYRPEPPLACSIGAFGGMQDVRTSPLELEGWCSQTAAQFTLRYFVGGHFFVQTALPELLDTLGALLPTATQG